MYRASVPVQYSQTSTPSMDHTACTEPHCLYSIAKPLLPLWTIQPVQSLSACTVELYLYSPQCLYSRAIPLLPSVPVQYSYTSTPTMGHMACTEPQCLYKGALFFLSLFKTCLYVECIHCQNFSFFICCLHQTFSFYKDSLYVSGCYISLYACDLGSLDPSIREEYLFIVCICR